MLGSVTPSSTPEEAARGDIPSQFVRVIGVVIRGDIAVVAQLTNDVPPFELEMAYCHRDGDGWETGTSGSGTSAYIPTGDRVGTVVVWGEAPADASAARFEYEGREQVVVFVENGCALAVFDDVTENDGYFDGPRLAAWIRADGSEEKLPMHKVPESMRADVLRFLNEGRVE
jgi:hypothetical protein